MLQTYWHPMPNMPTEEVIGKLIVLEGTDGVGRSTQIELLKNSLESSGLAVYDTGLTRSNLAGAHLQAAKEGHTMGTITQALYYATDFADRLLNEMIPALRAGYVVLTDRYIYSMMARAIVRGADPAWVRKVYGFAVVPDLILYLQADLQTLIPRVLASGGFDYWESGADYIHGDSPMTASSSTRTRCLASSAHGGRVRVRGGQRQPTVTMSRIRQHAGAPSRTSVRSDGPPTGDDDFSPRPLAGGQHPSTAGLRHHRRPTATCKDE